MCPDVFLVRGVGKRTDNRRRIYKLWEEGGRVPSLVIELTSESTRAEDVEKKKLYERLGVEEYFLFDPYGDYLEPRLQGQRLEGGRYIPMAPKPDGSLVSSTTGLILRPEGERLRLVDPAAGPLLWPQEMEAAREAAEEWACREADARRQEAAARQAAEQQARLEGDARRQEAAARQAAEERVRALEDELARLRSELDRTPRGG